MRQICGTKGFGGKFNRGAVFEPIPVGNGWTEAILCSLTGGEAV